GLPAIRDGSSDWPISTTSSGTHGWKSRIPRIQGLAAKSTTQKYDSLMGQWEWELRIRNMYLIPPSVLTPRSHQRERRPSVPFTVTTFRLTGDLLQPTVMQPKSQ